MKRQYVLLTAGTMLFFAACTPASNTSQDTKDTAQIMPIEKHSLPYKTLANYFIKNTVKEAIPTKIDSQQEFDKYFGMATTMGENGTPTPVDFANEFVIVVDYKETAKRTEMKVLNLENKGDELILTYSLTTGEDMGFTSHPFLLVVVNKNIAGKVVVQQEL